MITKERFIVEITADNRETFRTLKAAHDRSAELMYAGIPHAIVRETTELWDTIIARINDEMIKRAAAIRASL